jgi:ABC-type Mn2+/Zn2+ transport system permease subunit
VLGALALLHRQLLVVGFDRGSARAFGARPLRVDLALLGLVAAGVLVGVQALGNLLVVAVVVGPAATARLLTRRIVPMMALASGLALAAAVAGLYLYYADLAAGASVAVAIVAGYLVALALRQRLRPVR